MVSTASDNFIFVVTRWRLFQEIVSYWRSVCSKEQHSQLIHTAVHKNIDFVGKNQPEFFGVGGNPQFLDQIHIFTAGLRFPTHFSKT